MQKDDFADSFIWPQAVSWSIAF